MDKINIKINKTEKGEEVIALPEFGLGVIQSEKGIDESGNEYISIPISTEFIMSTMENAIMKHINIKSAKKLQEIREDIRGCLKEYSKAYILNTIGIEHTPIFRNDKGELVGFQKDVEANIITE